MTTTTLFSSQRPLTAAERERREEDQRRKERAKEVVIGQTSAQQGATDFTVNPQATEAAYLQQASAIDQLVYKETEQGLRHLRLLQISEAGACFDRVFAVKPEAYLWQAGIVKYYLGDYERAAEILTRAAWTFETRFGEPATEERIWRLVVALKKYHDKIKKNRKVVLETGGIESLVPELTAKENDEALRRSEMRKVLRTTRALFEAAAERDLAGTIVSLAKLRALGGDVEGSAKRPLLDRKLWRLNSWFYLGLYYDAVGNVEESKKCIKTALLLSPGSGTDLIHVLPMLHMSQRGWFDDEDIHDDDLYINRSNGVGGTVTSHKLESDSTNKAPRPQFRSPSSLDPALVESIRSGVEQLRYSDVQNALRIRGMKGVGTKEELQERLISSLLQDAGLMT
jgi:tetratricopeptide (TPR) repeat protein